MAYHGISYEEWNQLVQQNRPLPPTVNLCIHAEIERQARIHPSKVAFTSSEEDLTYDALSRLSDLVAYDLVDRGVIKEDIVPLCFDKSPVMIIFMIAVMKAGAAFLALDPEQPLSHTESVLHEMDAKMIITSETFQYSFPSDYPVLVPPSLPLLVGQLGRASKWSPPVVSPKNAAYCSLTRASTGEPSGVVLEHRSFVSGIFWNAPAQMLNEKSRALQLAEYWHDECITEILTTLCVGGTICAPNEVEIQHDLVEFINLKEVNWAALTPSFISTFQPVDVPTLETLVLDGETVPQSLIETWSEHVVVLGSYTVSECSGTISVGYRVENGSTARNIGRPAGVALWVVNKNNVHVLMPVGEVGEILIEGPTVGRGYINNPQATGAAFVKPPIWLRPILSPSQKGNRLFRTGVSGRRTLTGTFEIISGEDFQKAIEDAGDDSAVQVAHVARLVRYGRIDEEESKEPAADNVH
ncbi:Nonribosomal peptide synthetase 1 [Cercospora beticola]|uniref:Nonribosomal peptide synthetase 1 n=1 Tax=Cercospora beticola TaxID=122368 RepID=A0A2G5I2F1_CERBT|nr:Nonribosomal peptide synthetase 1 [Cercospora beticola]PIA98938.1 Nonribosomal peptide synthetase 1 [Cercospora beticola]WPA99598.1 hypothetical protein RHO25_004216 [Cercospora beticola]